MPITPNPLPTKKQIELIDILCSKLGATAEELLTSYSEQLFLTRYTSPHSLIRWQASAFIKFLQNLLEEQ